MIDLEEYNYYKKHIASTARVLGKCSGLKKKRRESEKKKYVSRCGVEPTSNHTFNNLRNNTLMACAITASAMFVGYLFVKNTCFGSTN